MPKKRKKDCTCDSCKSGCRIMPGWFLPGEAEKVAEFLDMRLKELFDTKIGVDWYEGYPDDTFVLSPARTNMTPGQEVDGDPRGQCVFFDEETELCLIHEVKPFECRSYHHDDDHTKVSNRHAEVAAAWKDNQEQIEGLLGYEPVSSEFFGGLFPR